MSSICVLLAACGGGSGGDSGSTAGLATGTGSNQGAVAPGTGATSQTGQTGRAGTPADTAGSTPGGSTQPGSAGGTSGSPADAAGNTGGNTGSTPSATSAYDATARFNAPGDLALGPAGTLYVMDKGNARIRTIAANGEVGTVPGSYSATYDELATDPAGNLSVLSDTDIYRVAPDGSRTLVASYPQQPGSYLPISISTGTPGSTHVLLRYRNALRVSEIDAAGTARTVYAFMTAGSATRIATDAQGNLAIGTYGPMAGMDYVKIVPKTAQPAEGGAAGVVDLPVTGSVSNLVYDMAGNLYVVCLDHEVLSTSPSSYRVYGMRVLRIASDRTVTTIASGFPDGSAGYTQSTPVGSVQVGLAADTAGNVYVSNPFNHAIYRIGPGGGHTLVAGKAGEAGSSD
ncbi:MAG TPA: hypothetical protein VEC35_07895 [Noviherbaspirillum sp.]|nr:hypothetical protein [Noviherbaspirillum sp.]